MVSVVTPKALWRNWTEPTVEGDFARRREAVLLNVLATFVVFGVVAQIDQVLTELFGPKNDQFWFWWPTLAITTGGFYGLLQLARSGRHRASTIALLVVLSSLSTVLLVDDGSNDSVWPLLTAATVLLAALLLGGKPAVVVAVWSAVVAATCAGLEEHGWIVPLQPVNEATLGGSLAPVLLIAMITRACWLYTREVITSVDDVISHGAEASPLRQLRTKDLTVREIEVVQLVTEGLTNDEIAKRLFLSPRTVQSHVARAMSKSGTANRTALGVLAVREGIAAPGTPVSASARGTPYR